MEIHAYPCLRPASRLPKRVILSVLAVAATLTLVLTPARSQEIRSRIAGMAPLVPRKPLLLKGHVVIPSSNLPKQGDKGMAYTNLRYFQPDKGMPDILYPPYSGYLYETPESIACRYGLVTAVTGCSPNAAVNVPNGGSQTIAIVDAYDDPMIYGDLAWFSDQMGLPLSTSQFHVVYAAGYEPYFDYSGGWELEEALDVEWAHAMAPKATLYLVEANSNSISDLMAAVQVATNLVECGKTTTCPTPITGKGEVSMSWGGGEFAGETSYDTYFNHTNVVYLASAGDSPGPIYPSTSPNVISVGGTAFSRNLSNGSLTTEIAWQDTGGYLSSYESKPSYQSSLSFTRRATPDVAADADPYTGLWVYDSFPSDGYLSSAGWWIVGGTSASVQIWAGLLNAASTANGAFAASTSAELTKLYGDMSSSTTYAADFWDITYGGCGPYDATFAGAKYDLCTGLGAPHGVAGK